MKGRPRFTKSRPARCRVDDMMEKTDNLEGPDTLEALENSRIVADSVGGTALDARKLWRSHAEG